MEAGHDEESDAASNKAKEFYAIVRGDAMGDVFGDPLVFYDNSTTSGEDDKT